MDEPSGISDFSNKNIPVPGQNPNSSSQSRHKRFILLFSIIIFFLMVLYVSYIFSNNILKRTNTGSVNQTSIKAQANPTQTVKNPKYAAFMRNGDIWFVNLSTSDNKESNAVKISKSAKVSLPRLSPNGKYVVYYPLIYATGGFPRGDIYLADTQGEFEENLGITNRYASRLTWSEDDNTLGFILFPDNPSDDKFSALVTLYNIPTRKKIKELKINPSKKDHNGSAVLTLNDSYNVNLNCSQLDPQYIRFCNTFQSILNQAPSVPTSTYKTAKYMESQYTKSDYQLIRSVKLNNNLVELEYYKGEPQNPESAWGEGGGAFFPGFDQGVTDTYTLLVDENTGKVVEEISLAIDTDFIF